MSFFSHYFADLTSPLLIAAQTALLQQLRDRKNSIDQPHFDSAITSLGRPIHPDDFFTLRPEKLFKVIDHSNDNANRVRSASTLSLGVRLDPKGSDYYSRKLLSIFIYNLFRIVFFSRKHCCAAFETCKPSRLFIDLHPKWLDCCFFMRGMIAVFLDHLYVEMMLVQHGSAKNKLKTKNAIA